jgi:hypothetical protein
MARTKVDPAKLEGEAFEQWYRRTPEELEEERRLAEQDRYDEFFGPFGSGDTQGQDQDGERAGERARWQLAKAPAAPVRPGIQPGADVRVGLPPRANLPPGRGRGFFGVAKVIPNPRGSVYVSNLPSPLNTVTPEGGGWFTLADGSLVSGPEVDRIYAEQQRLMSGADEPEPLRRVRSADRFKDGVVPKASELAADDRELDPTCHPNGGWEHDRGFKHYSKRSQNYEAQITRAPGLDYVVRNPGQKAVNFDGCAVWTPEHQLLEAKGPGRADLIRDGARYQFLGSLIDERNGQAKRQSGAATGRPVEWHIAEPDAVAFYRKGTNQYPGMRTRLTRPRAHFRW